MTVSYFVRYEVEAPDEFIRHYRDRHVPILARWPGMRRILLHTNLKVQDNAPASPERAEARRDFQGFPPYEGKVFHQAMAQEEVFRSPWLDGNQEEA